MDRPKFRIHKGTMPNTGAPTSKDVVQPSNNTLLWRANNLCYYCGDKFQPNNLQKCPKRAKPQLNALVLNDLNVELVTH
jgi:hypothetical protein